MSQKVRCEQCGGEDFRLESGFYFCSECQLQSQDIQEHVLDDYYGGTATSSRKIKKTEDEQSYAQQGPSTGNVSSVEVLNYVLKGLVDELILLGAPKKLKIVTLQLWATYLRKIEMAFTSTSVQKKPKVGLWYRQGDVARFYKVRNSVSIKDYPRLMKKKRKEMSKKSSSIRPSSEESRSVRSKKLRLSATKTSLARAEYDESQVEGSMNMSQATSLASLDLSHGSQDFSGGDRIMYTKEGKKDIRRFLEEVDKQKDKMKFLKRTKLNYQRTLRNLRLDQLVAILRIALILSGSDIHLGDLLRWSEEGYFSSYDCMRKLVPPHITLTPDQRSLFLKSPFQILNINVITSHMIQFLEVAPVGVSPSKIISNLVRRYCKILNLPDNVSTGIDELLKLKPPKAWLRSSTCNLEGRAMALIIFSLKILIGLDDVTEYTYVPRKDVEGVKWVEWCSQYEARMAKKALHHYPTLVRHYPDSYVGQNHSLLSHWDPAPAPKKGMVHNTKAELSMMDSFKRVLKPLVCKLAEPSWRPGLEHEVKSSGPPLAVLSECIDGSVRKGKRNIILELAQKKEKIIKAKPKNAMDLNVRVLNDDAEVEIKSTQQIGQPSSTGVEKVTGNEDYSVWVYHNSEFRRHVGHITFARAVAGKMPHSFWWLLRQTADIIHQTPHTLYTELVKVERVFTNEIHNVAW